MYRMIESNNSTNLAITQKIILDWNIQMKTDLKKGTTDNTEHKSKHSKTQSCIQNIFRLSTQC